MCWIPQSIVYIREKSLFHSKPQFLYPSNEKYSRIILSLLNEIVYVEALYKLQNTLQKVVDIFHLRKTIKSIHLNKRSTFLFGECLKELWLVWREVFTQLTGLQNRIDWLLHGARASALKTVLKSPRGFI